MTLQDYLCATMPRWRDDRLPCLRMEMVTLDANAYLAVTDNAMSVQIPELDDLLAIVAGEFARGLEVRISEDSIAYYQRKRNPRLELRLGHLPCDIEMLRQWITLFNLTQSWEHINLDDLKEHPCIPCLPSARLTD